MGARVRRFGSVGARARARVRVRVDRPSHEHVLERLPLRQHRLHLRVRRERLAEHFLQALVAVDVEADRIANLARRDPHLRELVAQRVAHALEHDLEAPPLLAEEIADRPRHHDLALLQDADAIAEHLDVAQDVRREEDRAPALRSSTMMSRTSLRPTGSRPLIGSSRISISGSCTSAAARPTRWSIPFDIVRTARSAA